MEDKVKELADKIKACGEYSIELDGYVVNPATVACKLSNDGYVKLAPITDLEGAIEKILDGSWCKDIPANLPCNYQIDLYEPSCRECQIKSLSILFSTRLASIADGMSFKTLNTGGDELTSKGKLIRNAYNKGADDQFQADKDIMGRI